MFADVFIKRPVLSTVCSLLIILAGAIAIPTLPIARYPELAPPAVSRSTAVLHRRQRADGGERGHHAARTGHQRRRGHDLHDLLVDQLGRLDDHGHVRHLARPGPGRRRRPEPRQLGARTHAGRRPDQRHHRHEGHRRVHGRAGLLQQGQPLHQPVHQQLSGPLRPRRDQARARRRRRHHLRRAALRDAAVARPQPARGAAS